MVVELKFKNGQKKLVKIPKFTVAPNVIICKDKAFLYYGYDDSKHMLYIEAHHTFVIKDANP